MLCLWVWPSWAQTGTTGGTVPPPDFSPPPVPEFMLKKPVRPLTLEEMQRQADEAAARARKDGGKAPAAVPPTPTFVPAPPPPVFDLPPSPGQPARQ